MARTVSPDDKVVEACGRELDEREESALRDALQALRAFAPARDERYGREAFATAVAAALR